MILYFVNTAFQTTVVICAIVYFFPDSKEIARTYAVKAAKEIIRRYDK